MNRLGQSVATVVGSLAILGTIFFSTHPVFQTLVPVDAMLDDTVTDYHLAAGIALLIFFVGIGMLASRAFGEEILYEPPSVERCHPHEIGRSFDDALDSLPLLGYTDEHRIIQSHLRTSAIDALVHHRGMTRQEAEQAIRNGRWTNNHRVSTMLADTTGSRAGLVTHRGRFIRRVGETVEAIETIRTGGLP